MKTVNVPQIGGLNELLVILSDSRKFKKHLSELKDALQELQEAAGGVEALREAGSLRNKVRGELAEASVTLASAREKAEAIHSHAVKRADVLQSVREALSEREQALAQERAVLKRTQETFKQGREVWQEKAGAERAELESKTEKLDQRSLKLVEKESVMRKKLKAANAALEA
ncbi:hypothetical protein LCGC14_1909970 [marine sediment metagenome]|uniref:Uncharacterized protein n=1 Tax=marine sediment metagenome TaxID=412755 RepID=A0A0F9GH85_9ZZZZ